MNTMMIRLLALTLLAAPVLSGCGDTLDDEKYGGWDPTTLGDAPSGDQNQVDGTQDERAKTPGGDAANDSPPAPVPSWPDSVGEPVVDSFVDVHAIGPGRALAVGRSGSVLGYSDGEWRSLRGPLTDELTAVWAPDETRFYVTGAEGLFYWDGFEYEQLVSGARLGDVHGNSAGKVFAVGEPGSFTGDGVVYGGRGNDVRLDYTVDLPGQYSRSLKAVWVGEDGFVWTGGWAEDGLLHHRGFTGWVSESPTGPVTYHAIHGASDGSVWAVGFKYGVLRFDGAQWSKRPFPGQYVNGVFALDADNAWVVSEEGIHLVTPERLERQLEDEPNMEGVHGSGPNDVWAVGGSYGGERGWIYHFDGVEWDESLRVER